MLCTTSYFIIWYYIESYHKYCIISYFCMVWYTILSNHMIQRILYNIILYRIISNDIWYHWNRNHVPYHTSINNHSDHASLSEVVKGFLSIFYDGNQALYLMIALYFKSKHTWTMEVGQINIFFQHSNLGFFLPLKTYIWSSIHIIKIKFCIRSYLFITHQ